MTDDTTTNRETDMTLSADQDQRLRNIEAAVGRLEQQWGVLSGRPARADETHANTVAIRDRPLVSQAALTQAVRDSAADIRVGLIMTLSDLEIERIRDACVEALELSKGTLNTTTSVMRFSRVAQ